MENLASILQKCYENREVYIKKNQLEAYRLYNNEKAAWPIAIDIYKNIGVIHVFESISFEKQQEIESTLKELMGVQDFFYKDRTKTKSKNLKNSHKKEDQLKQKSSLTIQEYGHSFLLNLSDYIDTGIFLDHRETRHWIEKQSKDKTVLNTFAYTGSFTIYAAAGGAKQTYSVDLSKTYCEWLRKNLTLNGFKDKKQHWVCRMDTFEFFDYARRKKLTFDIIIIDPPTFSRNKSSKDIELKNFSVKRDYPILISEAFDLLKPNGFILFSNNDQEFNFDQKKLPNCKVKVFDLIPPDFPLNYKRKKIHRSFIIQAG